MSFLQILSRQKAAVGPFLTVRNLKLLGAVLILSGLVLPLYSCRGRFVDALGREIRYIDEHGAAVIEPDGKVSLSPPPGAIRLERNMKPPAGVTYRKNYHYFFTDFAKDDVVDWFRLGGFLWPLAAAWWADRLRHPWSRWLFRCLEPFLVLETAFSLCIGAMFGAQETGFWSAWLGVILYAAGAAWGNVRALKVWRPSLPGWRRGLAVAAICAVFAVSAIGSVLAFFNGFQK